MDLSKYIKKFELPPDYQVPEQLTYQDIIARPLRRSDVEDDLEGVNSSIEIIQRTRGGSWPSEPLEKDFDVLDLAWHEREFRDGNSFAYVIYTAGGKYVGCFYLYPMGIRTQLNEQLNLYDVDASWWVTTEMYNQGYYEKVFKGLKQWLSSDFPFQKPYFSNKQIPESED